MSSLMNAGLIKRKNGKHTITAFGKVIYDVTLTTIEHAVNNYWKLKAIDVLETSNDVPAEQRKMIMNSFIDIQEIKDLFYRDDKYDSQYFSDTMEQQKNSHRVKAELLVH